MTAMTRGGGGVTPFTNTQFSYQALCGFLLPCSLQTPRVWEAAGGNLIAPCLKEAEVSPFFIVLLLSCTPSVYLVLASALVGPGKKELQQKHRAVFCWARELKQLRVSGRGAHLWSLLLFTLLAKLLLTSNRSRP